MLYESVVVRQILADDHVRNQDDWGFAKRGEKFEKPCLLTRPKISVAEILDANTQHAAIYRRTNFAKVVSLVLARALYGVVLSKILNLKCCSSCDMCFAKDCLVVLATHTNYIYS